MSSQSPSWDGALWGPDFPHLPCSPPSLSSVCTPRHSQVQAGQGGPQWAALRTRGGSGWCRSRGVLGTLSPSWSVHLKRVSPGHCPGPGQQGSGVSAWQDLLPASPGPAAPCCPAVGSTSPGGACAAPGRSRGWAGAGPHPCGRPSAGRAASGCSPRSWHTARGSC